MERLTIDEIIEHCKRHIIRDENALGKKYFEEEDMNAWSMKEYWEHKQVAEYLKELKQLKDKEEQGLLLELPCKVGDTVYFILREEIIPVLVDGFSINENGLFICGTNEEHFGYSRLTPPAKNLYLTRSEAESALTKMGGK